MPWLPRSVFLAVGLNGLSALLLCPDFFDPSSLAERTSDNQWLTTLVRNDLAQVAIYHIVTFSVGDKML